MVKGGCRNDQIGLKKSVTNLAASFNKKSPLEHDILGNVEHPLIEHGSNPITKPRIELRATYRIGRSFNTVTNFSERHGTDEQILKPLPLDEVLHARIWTRSTQLRDHIGIEQPADHKSMARTGISKRGGSISISRCGDACKASINKLPFRAP